MSGMQFLQFLIILLYRIKFVKPIIIFFIGDILYMTILYQKGHQFNYKPGLKVFFGSMVYAFVVYSLSFHFDESMEYLESFYYTFFCVFDPYIIKIKNWLSKFIF